MKALVYKKTGEPTDVLELVDLEIPEPGPNDVLVKMLASAVNHADLATVRGVYKSTQKLPTTPGLEGVGEIVKVGANVKGLKISDRVIKTATNYSGWENGTWQEYACWDEAEVFPIPKSIDIQTASLFYTTIIPTYVLLVSDLNLKPGQTVLVTAGGSTVGKLILQFAKIKKFSVIPVVRRPEQVQELLDLGATHVICSSTEDITQKALLHTQLKGVDAVIESIGGETASKCFQALANDGQMRIFGMLEGQRDAVFDLRKMLFSQIQVKGIWMNSWWFSTPADVRVSTLNRIIEMIETYGLSPAVGETFPFSEYKKAILQTEARENTGRTIMIF